MACISDFPKTLEMYSKDIPYTTQEELKEIVITIAKKISFIYARFLTSEGHEERNKLSFAGSPSLFPPNKEVNLFEIKLAERIIEELLPSQSSESSPTKVISLTIDYQPQEFLFDTLKKCKITDTVYSQFYKYFPWKTDTTISLNTELQILDIEMTAGDYI